MKNMTEYVNPEDAKRLLDDPVFNRVVDQMETNLVNAMVRSQIGDLDTHHHLVLSLQVLRNMVRQIVQASESGMVEKHNKNQTKTVV